MVDPEIPVLTIADLGVLRDVRLAPDLIEVVITPTYSGCPAMNMIAVEIELALIKAGFGPVAVTTVLAPGLDHRLDERGRPAQAARLRHRATRQGRRSPRAVRCGNRGLSAMRLAEDTTRLAEFGSTSCKALWRCNACREPFDYFRCH